MHRPGDIIDERYQLVRLIGLRAGAELWEAEHEVVGRKVTLKLLSGDLAVTPMLQTRLVGEARAASLVQHPVAVEVFDVGVTPGGEAYLVAELLQGETLADLMAQRGPLRPEEACPIAQLLLRGLQAAHEAGIVHGMLHPDAIVLGRDRTAQLSLKILDLGALPPSGLASLPPVEGHPTSVTELAAFRAHPDTEPPSNADGTPLYSAPELTFGSTEDPRADLFSVGLILSEMLTGIVPYVGPSNSGVPPAPRDSGLQDSHTGRDLPEPIARFLSKALAREPSERFQTASEMLAALEPFVDEAIEVPVRTSLMPLLSREARRSRALARLEKAVLADEAELAQTASSRRHLVVLEPARNAPSSPESAAATAEPLEPATADAPSASCARDRVPQAGAPLAAIDLLPPTLDPAHRAGSRREAAQAAPPSARHWLRSSGPRTRPPGPLAPVPFPRHATSWSTSLVLLVVFFAGIVVGRLLHL